MRIHGGRKKRKEKKIKEGRKKEEKNTTHHFGEAGAEEYTGEADDILGSLVAPNEWKKTQ